MNVSLQRNVCWFYRTGIKTSNEREMFFMFVPWLFLLYLLLLLFPCSSERRSRYRLLKFTGLIPRMYYRNWIPEEKNALLLLHEGGVINLRISQQIFNTCCSKYSVRQTEEAKHLKWSDVTVKVCRCCQSWVDFTYLWAKQYLRLLNEQQCYTY